VRRTRFDDWPCPIARATDLIGDWWTPLVMREFFYGRRRFDEIAESLQVPRAVLTARLGRLVEEGMLTRVAYQERPVRYEYRPTAMKKPADRIENPFGFVVTGYRADADLVAPAKPADTVVGGAS